LFRVNALRTESVDKERHVYRYGRSGKTRVIAGAAVVAVLAAGLLFVFVSSSGTENPAEPLRVLMSDADVLTKLALTASGDVLAAASAEGEVIVWRLPGRRSSNVGIATGFAATVLTWSPDGLLLCGNASGLLRAWQQPELEGSQIDSPRVPVTCCAFRQKLARRQMLLGLNDGRIVQLDQSETTLRDSGHRGVKAMLISQDQSVLVSAGSEGQLIWYGFDRDSVQGTTAEHDTEVSALAWSPDGTQIVSADWNGELRLWNAGTRKLVASAAQPDAVSALAWVGDRLVTGSWDGRIRVWNVDTKQIELSSTIYTGLPIHSLVVDSSGKSAFTASGDGNIREWNLKSTTAE
jgi:WD40 repeat protein